MTDGMATQVLNLILRRVMEGLNLQLLKRDFFDAMNKVISDFNCILYRISRQLIIIALVK